MRTNHQTITSRAVILAGLLFLCLFTASNASAYDYQVTEIQPPAGYTASRAMGINKLGEVVGRFYNIDPATGEAVNRKAFVWDKTNGASLLVTLAGETSAWAINDNGFVVGYSYNASGNQRAALWDLEEGTVHDIGALRNDSTGDYGESSTAYGINNLDQVVGNADIPNDANSFTPFHAFLDDATGIRDLGTLNTTMPEWQYGYSIAYDINDKGQVVGIAQDSPWAAFIYDGNGMRMLQKDPAYADGEWYAVVINNAGQIGGHVIAGTNRSLPFYWPDESSAPVKITMPEAYPYGEIYGINSSGYMVGIMWSSDQDGAVEHAFVFDQRHGVRDLNDLIAPESGWVLRFGRDVNDKGQIAGYGEKNGQKRGFVLNAAETVAGDFGALGLYHFANGSVVKLSALDPQGMQNAGGVLYVDFGTDGLYAYDGAVWTRISGSDAESLIGMGSDLYVDFGTGVGLYKYDGADWTRLTDEDPEKMVASETDLYVDFGEGMGLHRYNGSWKKISGLDPRAMCVVGGDLYVDFGATVGLQRYDGSAWAGVSKLSPKGMCTAGATLYADFGTDVGLYQYDGTAWVRVNKLSPETMCAVGSDLYVDFGPSTGLYRYDGLKKWNRLSKLSPERMWGAGTNLYTDFGSGVGLYQYDGSIWTKLSRASAYGVVSVTLP